VAALVLRNGTVLNRHQHLLVHHTLYRNGHLLDDFHRYKDLAF
jgi:hypothetical protein